MSAADRLGAVRALMRQHGFDAFIVPSEDAHMSEYVAGCDCRRAYISGFDGSAGVAVITMDTALCWTDGRYFVQAQAQLDPEFFVMMRMHEDPNVDHWLAANMAADAVVALDGATFSVGAYERLESVLASRAEQGVRLVSLPATIPNIIDTVWAADRPPTPASSVFIHPLKYAGWTAGEKLDLVRDNMRAKSVTHHIVAGLDEVAWLLNLRGADVDYNPVFWSYVLVSFDRVTLYCDSSRFADGVMDQLDQDKIIVRPYDAMTADLKTGIPNESVVWVDSSVCNYAIYKAIEDGANAAGNQVNVLKSQGPIPLAKAKKNETELAGMRSAHIRDAVAVVKFLSWLEKEVVVNGKRPTECEAADKLDGLRADLDLFVSLSFPTISSTGSNGAIVHYRPMPESCARIDTEHVYLVDSGGQYRDGTTDITRTVHFGTPTEWQKECFTRVLRGHIALDSAVFPKGTTGHLLDAFARKPLWEIGRDYKHGTGHGVGSALCVHEGPHVLSFKPAAQATALEPGFLTSNEPGYYEENAFGIRIENILAVVVPDGDASTDDRPFFAFEHLTLVPLQQRMMDVTKMSASETEWVDKYHAKCYKTIAPLLADDSEALNWLVENTQKMDVSAAT